MSTELTISKSNSFVEASYQMTLDEMRVLALTLGVFDPLNPKRGFDLTVAEFVKAFPEVNPERAYEQVQNAIRKISSRWMTLRNDANVLHEVAFVTDRIYYKQEGRFYIEFHEKLLPYIANLKNRYTKYELVHIGAFSSTHTIRLYELLAQYKSIGNRSIELDKLKDWLQISDKYQALRDFKKRVLNPAIDEINKKSDLLVEYEPIKRGRKIDGLSFTIKLKKDIKDTEKRVLKLPNKSSFGKYTKLDRQNPAMSSAEYADYAKACLKALDDFYNDISEVTNEHLRNYWVFLACNASFKSKLGNKQKMLEELRKRGFKLVDCELVKIDEKQIDLVDDV